MHRIFLAKINYTLEAVQQRCVLFQWKEVEIGKSA